MNMEGVELVVAKNSVEEVGERGNQPREDTVLEEGVEGAAQSFRLGIADLERRLSTLIAIVSSQLERGGEVLLLGEGGRVKAGSNQEA